jgi:hypothetical protein
MQENSASAVATVHLQVDTRRDAFRCVALLMLVILLALGIAYRDRLNPRLSAISHLDDTALHGVTIARLRTGEPYYATVGAELRARGYPAASVANWRTPLHYRFVAVLGLERAGYLLTGAALLAILLSGMALHSRFRFAGIVAPIVLLGTMLPALLNRDSATLFPENWSGVLIALSLAMYHLRWCTAGAALGVVAIFVRELAAPYGLVCGVLALLHKRRTESAVWVLGGLVYAGYYALHAIAVTDAIQPGDYAWPHSWVRWLGWSFVLQTAWLSTWTMVLPYAVTPIVAVLGLAGTAARSMPAQLRVSLLVYAALFCAVGQEFNYYWGWVTAPLWAYALLYCQEGLSTLLMSARTVAAGHERSTRHDTRTAL